MTKAAVARDQSAEYAWSFPGIPVRIHIQFTVIAQLRGILQEKNTADEHRHETGGLLLGRRRADAIEINGFQLLETARGDRHFAVSPTQQGKLRTSLQTPGCNVIGYFRSDLRGAIRLVEQDLVIIKEFFHDPTNVFLVIRTEDERAPTAGFFFWDNGSIFSDASFMQFPFDERVLPAATPKEPETQPKRVHVPHTEPVQIANPVQVAEPAQPPQAAKHSARPNRNYRVVVASVGLVAIAGSLAVYAAWRSRPQTPVTVARPATMAAAAASPLLVSASRLGKGIAITWDSHALTTINARVGVLTIKDGDSQAEFPLTKAQLQANKYIYTNRSELVEVTLEVFPLQGTPMRDSIIVALADGKVPPSTSASSAMGASTQRFRVDHVAQPVVKTNTKFVVPLSTRSTVQESTAILQAPPPPMDDRLNSARLNAPEFLPAAPSISHAAPPVVTSSPEPTPRTSSPVVSTRPPEILRQIRPTIPSNILAMVKRQVEVQVRLSIDKEGKVTRSELVTPMRGVPDYIGAATVNATRYWTFKPARREQVPVDSELIVRFTFGP
jgi:hypothetical protein